ncbi:MAG: hypothetical protein AAFO75_10425, partial [Pseudomonadota bacterium]
DQAGYGPCDGSELSSAQIQVSDAPNLKISDPGNHEKKVDPVPFGATRMLKQFALNLNHLTLPEIIDFNALGDAPCIKLNAKRFKATKSSNQFF